MAPNKACTGRLGLCALFGAGSELWQFSVTNPFSPQPPVTPAVGRLAIVIAISQSKNWINKIKNYKQGD